MEVPKWSKGMTVDAWKRSVRQWDKTSKSSMKKYLKLTEYLKTETEHEGLKEYVIDHIIEAGDIREDDPNAVEMIISKIVDFADETLWKKTGDCVDDLLGFEKLNEETMKQFIARFERMVTRMKNAKIRISEMFLANFLLKKSKLTKIEKKAILSKTDLDKTDETLKTLKNALKDLCADDDKDNDVHQTLYGGYTPGKRHGSRNRFGDRNSRFGDRNRSSSRGRSYSGSQNRSKSYEEYQKWKKNQYNSPSQSKQIYECQVFKMDLQENLFDQDTVNLGIVDSGCPEAVAGLPWFKLYVDSRKQKENLSKVESSEKFQFGPGKVYDTKFKVKLPVKIGKLEEKMEVHIVDANVPFLFSGKQLERWDAEMKFRDKKMKFGVTGETHDIIKTKSGHYALPLNDEEGENELKMIMLTNQTKVTKKKYSFKELRKMHKILAHKPPEDLLKLFKDAGKEEKELKEISLKLNTLFKRCKTCNKFRRKEELPKTALPKATEMNEVVSIDLKPVGALLKNNVQDKRQIVYMVDEFTGFMKAKIVKDKTAEEVFEAVNEEWCLSALPGHPTSGFYADNGPEFNNKDFKAATNRLGLKLKLGPSHSPWSNGKCERRHAVIDLMMLKMMEDDKTLKVEKALKYALYSYNTKEGKHGISPQVAMCGKGSFIPGILDGNIATDSKIVGSEAVRVHFERINMARKALLEADSNKRIKEALSARAQQYMDRFYRPGEKVFFLDENKTWQGPGVTGETESQSVWIKWHGNIRKVNRIHLRPFDTEEDLEELNDDDMLAEDSETEDEAPSEVTAAKDVIEGNERFERRPKLGREITFKLKDEEAWREGKVKNVGKKASKDQNNAWITEEDGINIYNFYEEVETWKYKVMFVTDESAESSEEEEEIQIPENIHNVFAIEIKPKDYGRPDVQQAMRDELLKFDSFGAYKVVDISEIPKEDLPLIADEILMDTKWVINKKEGHDGLKVDIKARLCLRGFKELATPRKDSPTVSKDTLKTFLTVCANEKFDLENIDVTSAFLQGRDIPRKLYVKPPKEAETEGKLWLMIKPGYGLLDAGRLFYLEVDSKLREFGMEKVTGDEAFYMLRADNKLCGLIVLHVDDFLGGGNQVFRKQVLDRVYSHFKCSKREVNTFRFTGLDIKRSSGGISVDQNAYAETIKKVETEAMEKENPKENLEELSKFQYKQYRGLVGKLGWLCEQTRPDLSFEVLSLAFKNKDAKISDLKEANKAVERIKNYTNVVEYKKVGSYGDLKIVAISDASFKKIDSGAKSVAGRIVFLSNKDETRVSPLMWKGKTIATTCKSAKCAETRALDKLIDDAIYCARMIAELYEGKTDPENQIPVTIYCDNQGLLDSVNSTQQIEEKLLRPTIQYIKDTILYMWVSELKWVDTANCLADALTKINSNVREKLMSILRTGNMINLKRN